MDWSAELRTKELRKCLKEVDADMMAATRQGLQFAGKKLAEAEKPMVRVLEDTGQIGSIMGHGGGLGPNLPPGPFKVKGRSYRGASTWEFARHNRAIGRTPIALSQWRKANNGKQPSMGRAIPGLLRFSAHASKVRQTFRDQEWKLAIGPMGGRANLYRKKIEALDHYAQKTYDMVPAVAKEQFEIKYAKVMDTKRSQNPGRWGEG